MWKYYPKSDRTTTVCTVQVPHTVAIAVLVAPDVDPIDNLILPPRPRVRTFTFRVDQHQRHHGDNQRQPAQQDDGDTDHAQSSPEGFGRVLQQLLFSHSTEWGAITLRDLDIDALW